MYHHKKRLADRSIFSRLPGFITTNLGSFLSLPDQRKSRCNRRMQTLMDTRLNIDHRPYRRVVAPCSISDRRLITFRSAFPSSIAFPVFKTALYVFGQSSETSYSVPHVALPGQPASGRVDTITTRELSTTSATIQKHMEISSYDRSLRLIKLGLHQLFPDQTITVIDYAYVPINGGPVTNGPLLFSFEKLG